MYNRVRKTIESRDQTSCHTFELFSVAPQIVPISDVVLKEGDSTRLECNATGVPAPDVVWIKEGKEFAGQEVIT